MKRFLATILSLIVLVGCVQSDTDNPIVRIETDEPFYGSFEDVNATRTYVNEAMTMLWHADDRISLFRSTLNEEFKFAGETGDSAGSFEEIPSDIFVTGAEISTNYGVYPYNSATTIGDDETITLTMPSVQTYAQNSFGCGANTAVAATESSSSRFLPFRNVGGFLVVKIYSPSGVVKSVELKGNNGEVLAGEATVQAKYGYLPLLTMGDGTDSITLDCGGGVEVGTTEDSATHFWFVVPSTTFESGFTVSVTDTAGAVTTKSTTKRNEILRNEVTVMSAFEIAETENKPTPANNEIWYTAPAKLEPYDNSVFGATYLSNIWDSETGKGVITFEGDVTKIGDYAFYNRTSLTSVTIGDSVTTIGNGAFWGCDSLTNVIIGNGVTTIGVSAFSYCSSLTSVTIPDSVTSIVNQAFFNCDSLTSVYCKATTPPTLGYNSFGNNGSGRKIYVPAASVEAYKKAYGWSDYADYIVGYNFENGEVDDEEEDPSHPANPANSEIWYINGSTTEPTDPYSFGAFGDAIIVSNEYDSENGHWVITFNRELTTIGSNAFYGCGSIISITIPDSVTTIGYRAFYYCSSLTSVTIPDSVTTIEGGAFQDCTSLTSVTIPDSVTTIGDYAFAKCTSLTSITIPDSVTTIGDYAFSNCESLTSITIPDSVTTIGEGAFVGCSSLTSVTIPDSVTTIGDFAFYDCYSLTSITIPDSVTKIGYEAFRDCTSLTSVTIPDSVTTIEDCAFAGCDSLTSVTIGNSVTTIGVGAFSSCDSLASVTIGNSVKTIGERAFDYCTNLTNVTIGNSVTTIGDYAFECCINLTNVNIPDSVTTIGEGAFSSCDSLNEFNGKFAADNGRCLIMDNTLIAYAEASGTTYTIPDSVTTIGYGAFSYCKSLTSVTIPDSVTTIGTYAFAYCSSLPSVTIPDSVTSIGNYAFQDCDSLTSVTIPDSVTSIGYRAFYDCDSLKTVYCKPTTPPTGGSYMFDYNAAGRRIFVPASDDDSIINAYKEKKYWSDYADYIFEEE